MVNFTVKETKRVVLAFDQYSKKVLTFLLFYPSNLIYDFDLEIEPTLSGRLYLTLDFVFANC